MERAQSSSRERKNPRLVLSATGCYKLRLVETNATNRQVVVRICPNCGLILDSE